MEQQKIERSGPLLTHDGTLAQRGWATDLILDYARDRVKSSWLRIKEWDYYCVLSRDFGASFTIADSGYFGFVSVTLFDFKNPKEETKTAATAFPRGSFRMPPSSKSGDIEFHGKELSLSFERHAEHRFLRVVIPSLNGKAVSGNLTLTQPPEMETMVIATPFAKRRRAFYYNQKINCMPVEGTIQCGSRSLVFDPSESFGVLDWGRGVWTYANDWYWGSASGLLDGAPFGFNIGYGFGDTSAATENMLFYRGRAHKLAGVEFHIPEPDFLKPWRFSSTDGRFEMDFVPILDRFSDTNALIVRSLQHQVFGRFSGVAVLDDGTRLQIRDFLGFAEKVKNRW